jgi:hypothetical protein
MNARSFGMRAFWAVLYCASAHATGTCTGGLTGAVGLSLRDSLQSVQAAEVPFVFGAAECQCPNDDFALDIYLTSAFPAGTTGTAELWAGAGCDVPAVRTAAGQTACEKLGSVDFAGFVVNTASSHTYLPFSSQALFSPVTHVCPSGTATNGLYVLLFTGANSNPSGAPAATCSLELTEQMAGPGAPANVVANLVGDRVEVAWEAPDATLPQPYEYQILCADLDGNPRFPSPPPAAYSTCADGTLHRRLLNTAAQAGGLAALDPRFLCTPPLPPEPAPAIGLAQVTSGQFMVVAIDPWGNATAAPVVTVRPPLSAQGGGCSLAPRGGFAWLSPLLLLLGVMLLVKRVTTRTKY